MVSILAALAVGCDDGGSEPDGGVMQADGGDTVVDGGNDGVDAGDALPENAADAVDTYARIVLASYDDTIAGATALQTALEAFTADPTEANLQAAKDAWLAAREPYGQTEVYRFYEGPIDNAIADDEIPDGPEGFINAWPMNESFVDYVEGDLTAGVINDTAVTIDAATLESYNGMDGDDANVATGWHPIEFLLWGQDLSETGPGERPASDFQDDGATAENEDRRRLYLTTTGELLRTHLQSVRDQWAEGSGAYRTAFVAADPQESLQKILAGMVILSGFETGGERLQTALDTGDQEDEHSCFSDNTHRDMYLNALGVQNVYLGTYTATDGTVVEGTGVYDVVAALDQGVADQLAEQIQASVDAGMALSDAAEGGESFDQLIAHGNTEGRATVQALIDALRAQEETMVNEVFPLLGISVEIPE